MDSEITIKAPDLSALADLAAAHGGSLNATIAVGVPDDTAPGGFVSSDPAAAAAAFTFELPVVTSVQGADGELSGSIIGGYQLTITGTGFMGATHVGFFVNGSVVKTVPLDSPSASDTEITVAAPDLSSLADQIAAGKFELKTQVSVAVPDANAPGGFVEGDVSVASEAAFTFEMPLVTSVQGADGQLSGSIIGGYQLTITGSGFMGATHVGFFVDGSVVKTVALDAPSESDTEITVTAPDLSSLVDQIPAGKFELKTGVSVVVPDANAPGGFVESDPSVAAGAVFTFELPVISSVVAMDGGDSLGRLSAAIS